MHHELRIKSLLEVMRGNTASLEQIQAITGIEPLVVRKVLVDLQVSNEVFFTGKAYGLVDYAEGSIQIWLERADEYIAKQIEDDAELEAIKPKDMTRTQLGKFVDKYIAEKIQQGASATGQAIVDHLGGHRMGYR